LKKIVTLSALTLTLAITLLACTRRAPKPVASAPPADVPDVPALTVANETEWNAALLAIKNGGNNKTYAIQVTASFDISGTTENAPYFQPTFGSVQDITVTINGYAGTEAISVKTGTKHCILKIDTRQNVIINNISLKGNSANENSLVEVDSASASFTMKGSASISDTNADVDWGGGVVSKGNFVMQDSASIHDNKNVIGGGGVCILNGNFTMKDRARIYNNTTRDGGGGVWVWGGNFTMQDSASVSANTSAYSHGGGGVWVSKGTFTMKDNASVFDNAALNSMGGGVLVSPHSNGDAAAFIMEGGSVYGNKSTGGVMGKGGGVAVFKDNTGSAHFSMSKGTIYGADAEEKAPNTVESGGAGAALYVDTGNTVQPATLATSEKTVKGGG